VLERVDQERFPLHADAGELPGHGVGLGLVDVEVGEEDELPFLDPLRERRLERRLLLLRVHLVGVVARLRPEDRAAVAVDRRAVTALPGPARALLPERLLARAGHFGAVLDLVRSLAERGEVVAHRLVDQVLLVRIAEDVVGQLDRADLLVVPVLDVDGRHRHSPRFPFLEKRTTTRPFLPPGTAPLMWRRLVSASTLATRRFLTVTCSPPMRPAIRMPFMTREGKAEAPIEPGARWNIEP